MTRRLVLALAGVLFASGGLTAADRKPNVIVILADDMGYADIGVNGCKDIPTPNIDSLAKNGVAYTCRDRLQPSLERREKIRRGAIPQHSR